MTAGCPLKLGEAGFVSQWETQSSLPSAENIIIIGVGSVPAVGGVWRGQVAGAPATGGSKPDQVKSMQVAAGSCSAGPAVFVGQRRILYGNGWLGTPTAWLNQNGVSPLLLILTSAP